MHKNLSKDYFKLKMVIFGVLIVIAFFASFSVGRYSISIKTVWDIILSKFTHKSPYWDPVLETVVLEIRLPRIILALLIGGSLSISGASYQTLFKNPMVSPDILGVSAGAGFGAALAMLNGASWWQIQLSALVFGTLAVVAAYLIGNIFGGQNITVLVLAGVVVSSFFQALLSIVKTLADTDNTLPSITFWLMGSLSRRR
jgi:iron complex transport system permease protein